MTMKRIACIAECCCDMIFAGLPRIPALGEEVYCGEFALKAGGGANTPISLARLGVPTTMVTRIGGDDLGRTVLEALESAGVRVMGKLRQPGSRTEVSAVLSTAVDRCFASYVDAPGIRFEQEDLEKAIRECDIVHTFLGYCMAYPIADLCEKYGRELSLDASWLDTQDRTAAERVLRRADYLKLNDREAMRLAGCDTPEEALKALSGLVKKWTVVTLGSGGSIGKSREDDRIFRKDAVTYGQFRDSCGAGDNYAAGLLYGLAHGAALDDAMTAGAHIAGQSVTWCGGNDISVNCTKIGF